MRRMLPSALLAAFALATSGVRGFAADEPASLHGKISAVTVYRGQALVTRAVDLPAATGLREVVVSELPEHVLPNSLFAENPDGGIEVRSINYRVRPVEKDVRAEVAKLDDTIRLLQDQLAANERNTQVQGEQKAYLDKLEQFTAPTANVELSKGVLNAETVKMLTQFVFQQRQTIADTELKLQQAGRDLNDQLTLRQRERSEVAGGSARTIREAVVFINQVKANAHLSVRYLVDSASWSPSYNIRADANHAGATVEYNASISQMSGEDWPDVQMTLSTATPSLIANAPMLAPLAITLESHAAEGKEKQALDYSQAREALAFQRQAAESNRSTNFANNNGPAQVAQQAGGGGRGNNDGSLNTGNVTVNGKSISNNDVDLNKLADQLQVLELVAKESKKEDVRSAVQKASEGIVITYQLARGATVSLPSRADTQLIQIDSFLLKGDFYKVAIPVLTNYVYDEASLTNSSSKVLLAGPVASYMSGQFVGNGEIPTVAAGEAFTVGFGIDSSLRTTRERTDKTDSVQGGNRILTYTYRIAVENFGATPANVRLLDRLPTAKDSEVKIALDSPSRELSKDKDYLQADRKNGILRWDVETPPQKTGTEAFSLDYTLHMEYDKSLSISNLPIMKLQELTH